jgi:pimeloyl-ACP methyl ester carboxylesterase
MADPEQLRVDANGLSFGALAWGDPAAPLALLVHGYPDTAWTWRHLGPYLAERGWRAVAPFTRGYAPTDLAPDDRYLVADLARDVLALHTALGGDERAVLIGHDWGAAATYAVAAAEPGRFSAYVTLAVPPLTAILKPLSSLSTLGIGARQIRMSWYMIWNQLPGSQRSLDRLIPRLWRTWSPGYDGAKDVAHLFAALNSRARRRAALRYYRNNLQRGALKTFTIKPQAPLLYLHGENDGCMQAEIMSRFPETLPQGSRYERVAGVGHFLQLEDPARVNALIEEWISARP